MNIIEAVKLAFEGKKIRRKDWCFISKDRCVHIFASTDIDIQLSRRGLKKDLLRDDGSMDYASFLPIDILANDWEVVDDE